MPSEADKLVRGSKLFVPVNREKFVAKASPRLTQINIGQGGPFCRQGLAPLIRLIALGRRGKRGDLTKE